MLRFASRFAPFAVATAASLALAACPAPSGGAPDAGQDADPSCGAPYLGDPSKSIELEIHALLSDGLTDAPLAEGGDLALVFPPQGGRVAFVGARATNLDPCGVQLKGALRDLGNQSPRVDARTVNLNPTGDGWGTTAPATPSVSAALASYSNVSACPNQWASTDVFDHEFQLEVTLTDRRKRTMTKTIKVTPRCNEAVRVVECKCLCKVNYVLGEACGGLPDGGLDDAAALGGDR